MDSCRFDRGGGGGGRGGRGGRGGGGRGGGFGGGGGGPPRESGASVRSGMEDEAMAAAFGDFQTQLDARHDRLERVVKLSRDVTIESKRIIFRLHGIAGSGDRKALLDEVLGRLEALRTGRWAEVAAELEGQDPFLFLRAYTPGLQEYVEAVSLFFFLAEGRVVGWAEVCLLLTFLVPGAEGQRRAVRVPRGDFVLGLGDLGGELMRYAINSISKGDLEAPRRVAGLLRALVEALGRVARPLGCRDMAQKLSVLAQSRDKVERSLYALQLRTAELPGAHVPNALLASLASDAFAHNPDPQD